MFKTFRSSEIQRKITEHERNEAVKRSTRRLTILVVILWLLVFAGLVVGLRAL